jgi:hypothetical protein
MATDRRTLLAALAAFAAAPLIGGAAGTGRVRFAAGAAGADGSFGVALLDGGLGLVHWVPAPGRIHGVVRRPGTATAVALARRPGTFALVLDLRTGEVLARLDAGPGRHFFGHGAFSADGSLFLASENDLETRAGLLGIRDAARDWAKVAEVPTVGIGPHELLRAQNAATLVIANGGIATDPGTGRAVLNLGDMDPSLVELDPVTGSVLRRAGLPADLKSLSLRHLAATADGRVVVGAQDFDPATALRPLVGVLDPGRKEIMFLDIEEPDLERLAGYIGSIAVDGSGRLALATAPRGNCLALFDLAVRRCLGTLSGADVCGVAPAPTRGFLLTTGFGQVARLDDTPTVPWRPHTAGIRFDNHLSVVG